MFHHDIYLKFYLLLLLHLNLFYMLLLLVWNQYFLIYIWLQDRGVLQIFLYLFHTYLQAVGIDSQQNHDIDGRAIPIGDPLRRCRSTPPISSGGDRRGVSLTRSASRFWHSTARAVSVGQGAVTPGVNVGGWIAVGMPDAGMGTGRLKPLV